MISIINGWTIKDKWIIIIVHPINIIYIMIISYILLIEHYNLDKGN